MRTENICTIIRRLNARKMRGMDKITNKMIKELSRKGVAAITSIVNGILYVMLNKLGRMRNSLRTTASYLSLSLSLLALGKLSKKANLWSLREQTNELDIPPKHVWF